MAVEFFAPVDSFGLAGASSDWDLVGGGSPQHEHGIGRQLGAEGDEIAHKEYDKKETVTCTYAATKSSGNLSVPAVGSLLPAGETVEAKDKYHVDSVKITYSQTEYPTLEVTGHRHLIGAPDTNCRTYSPTVELPAKDIGIPNVIDGAFDMSADTLCGMRALTYTLQVNHVDEANCTGGHLAGNNYDGSEQFDIELTGNVSETEMGFGTGWTVDTDGVTQSNTAATTSSYSISHHIAHDATV